MNHSIKKKQLPDHREHGRCTETTPVIRRPFQQAGFWAHCWIRSGSCGTRWFASPHQDRIPLHLHPETPGNLPPMRHGEGKFISTMSHTVAGLHSQSAWF